MLRNYLRIATRILARNKLYTAINVLGLALGVCGCIIIWLVGSYELSFDKSHPDGDRIYRVVQGGKTGDRKEATVIPPMSAAMQSTIPGLENITTIFPYNDSRDVKVPSPGKTIKSFQPRLPGSSWQTGFIIADQDWFNIFSYQWLAGNPKTALKTPFQVVLTENAAKLYFGNTPANAIIGKELIYQDSLHVHVSGVIKDWTKHSDLAYTDIISFPTIDASFLKEKRHMDDWIPHEGMNRWDWPFVFVKLKKGVKTAQIEAGMDRIATNHSLSDNPKDPWLEALQPISDLHFNSDYNDNRRKANMPILYGLAGIALFILILAAVNFINLATAQSLQRAKEIGVRKVLGSDRKTLTLQFLIETGVLTTLAIVLAAIFVTPVLHYFSDYVPVGVKFDPFAPMNLLFLIGTAITVTVLAGFYPARVLAGYQPVQTLKGSGAFKGGEKWWLRKSLIVFQFTISLIFIIVTLVIGNQIRYMLNTDYGFHTDAIVTVQGQGSFLDTGLSRIQQLTHRYSQLPGIAEVIPESTPPAGWGAMNFGMQYRGKKIMDIVPGAKFGDERYIPFYGLHIIAGRNIHHSDSLTEWVINETMVKQLGLKEPGDAIGQMINWDDKTCPIVGVVADFHQGSFAETIGPVAIGHLPNIERDLAIRLASTGKSVQNVKSTLDAMEKIYKEIYPNTPFPYQFMDDSIRDMYEAEQKTASLVRIAMGLAIFISCMGLFGLSLLTAERRSGEIGIRKVLGASTRDIALMLNRDFVKLVLIALIIASPVAWIFAHRWLQNFAYRVSIDVWVFLLAGLGAVMLAILTVSYQSIRAALTSPVKSLKSE